MIFVATDLCAKVSAFKIERNSTGIWVYHPNGHFAATDDDWREIIKQVSALLEPEKVEAAPEETPESSVPPMPEKSDEH